MLIDRINLEPGETVLATTRRHKFLIVMQLLSIVLVAFIPPLLFIFVGSNMEQLTIDVTAYGPHLVYLYAVWLLFAWLGAFVAWTDYYLDVLIVTNHRLILANQKGLWRRSLSSFRLERLQEVNVEINGILPTLLDFGTLRAETAGHGEEEFHMSGLPNPRELKATIMDVVESRSVEKPLV